MASFYSGGYRGDSCGSLEPPPLSQNYLFSWGIFQKIPHRISNYQVQFLNRTPLCKFEPTSKNSWIRPCFYNLFYFIYMGQPIFDPYGTRFHCPYGCPCGSYTGPISVPYRLLAGGTVYLCSALNHSSSMHAQLSRLSACLTICHVCANSDGSCAHVQTRVSPRWTPGC